MLNSSNAPKQNFSGDIGMLCGESLYCRFVPPWYNIDNQSQSTRFALSDCHVFSTENWAIMSTGYLSDIGNTIPILTLSRFSHPLFEAPFFHQEGCGLSGVSDGLQVDAVSVLLQCPASYRHDDSANLHKLLSILISSSNKISHISEYPSPLGRTLKRKW